MDSKRLRINDYDLTTSTIEQEKTFCGYTVVKAPKGPVKPIRIPANGSAKIQDIFGKVSEKYPELFEASVLNSEYDLFISAPYNEGTSIPVAYITGKGIFKAADNILYTTTIEDLVNGEIPDDEIPGITMIADNTPILQDVRYAGIYGEGENVNNPTSWINSEDTTKSGMLVFTGMNPDKLPEKVRIANLDTKIADLSQLDFTVVKTGTGINASYVIKQQTSIPGSEPLDVGDIVCKDNTGKYVTYTESMGERELVLRFFGKNVSGESFDLLTHDYVLKQLNEEAERKVLTISWIKAIENSEEVYGVIFPKYASERPLHISFNPFNSRTGYIPTSVESRNIFKITAFEEEAFHDSTHPISFTGSLKADEKDANGLNIGFNANNIAYNKQDLLCVYSINNFTSIDELTNKFIKEVDEEGKPKSYFDYPSIVLDGGKRNTEGNTIELHNKGWDEVNKGDYSEVDIFFDSEIHEYEKEALTATTHHFFGLASEHNLAGYIFNYTINPESIEGVRDALDFGPNYWNTCNEAVIALPGTGAKFLSPMTGSKALMECRILEYKYGGVAPMYLSTGSPALGGQLPGITVQRLKYKYNKDQQMDLDDLNFNPVISDRTYGVMSVGQKTCRFGEISDWSYIGHVASFISLKKEIRENVMIPQLGKPNNPYYRTLRKEQVEQMLAKRLNGNERIWAEASVDTSTAPGINDEQALRNREFRLVVKVRTDIFSEHVVLDFYSYNNSGTVEA